MTEQISEIVNQQGKTGHGSGLSQYLNMGFGSKNDAHFLMIMFRNSEAFGDPEKNFKIYQYFMNVTSYPVFKLIEKKFNDADPDKKDNTKRAEDFVERYVAATKQLYYGPGTAYLVAPDEGEKSTVLHSNVGWLELKPLSNPTLDSDGEHLMVQLPSFRVEQLFCEDFCNGGRCFIYQWINSEGGYPNLKRKCMKCAKAKGLKQEVFSSTDRPDGVHVGLHKSLQAFCRKQLETNIHRWYTFVSDYLTEHSAIKAPGFDSEFAGQYLEKLSEDPNKDWIKPFEKTTKLEWIRDFNRDYIGWLESKGFDTSSKYNPPPRDKKDDEYPLYGSASFGEEGQEDSEAE